MVSLSNLAANFERESAMRALFYCDATQGSMMIVNPVFHRFFVIRMELILSQLTKVADQETSISLLAAFFNAFKAVWLLHHLAFAHELPVSIFRVPVRADFDPRFMEQVSVL